MLAERTGLDLEQFGIDSKDSQIQDKIKMDIEQGIRSGVNATPTFFINGGRLLAYDGTYDSLSEAITEENLKYMQFLNEINE